MYYFLLICQINIKMDRNILYLMLSDAEEQLPFSLITKLFCNFTCCDCTVNAVRHVMMVCGHAVWVTIITNI